MDINSPVFNFHDVTVLFAVGQYLLLGVFLLFTHRNGDRSTVYLILILISNALLSADSFIIWSDTFRLLVLQWNPNVFFLGGIAFWLQGPLLYWYVHSVLYKDFRFSPLQLLHLVPAFVVAVLLYVNYYSLNDAAQQESMQGLQFMFGRFTEQLVTYRNISVIAYGMWCCYELFHYRKEVRQQYADYDASERNWLIWVVAGIVSISAWSLFVHKIGVNLQPSTSNILGVATNYLTFIFVNSLVFLSIRYAALFDGIYSSASAGGELNEPIKKAPYTEEQVQRLEKHMRDHKPYLTNDIHIESLAKQISVPTRTLSMIINQHFDINFFEFINRYRIDEAKRLLLDPEDPNKTILQVILETGFGSKSSFNSIFKQHVGMTPSEFRRKHRSGS